MHENSCMSPTTAPLAVMQRASLRERSMAHRLLAEHEMGELFKVIAFTRDLPLELLGFAAGDRTHRL